MASRDQGGAAAHLAADDRFDGWSEAGIDPTRPNTARVYDYWLGGHHNLVADRELAEAMATLDPWIPAACKANRAFLSRAARFLAAHGIRQFLDIGSGIPTAGNVHQIAQSAAADARVVYVDRDPVAVAMGRKLLTGNDRAAVVQADLRDLDAVLADPAVGRLIEFAEPVAIMLVAILHFVLDADEPYRIVSRLRDIAAPGSYLVVSHATSQDNQALATAAERLYNSRAADGQARSREQIAGFFGDWDLAEPGLVYVPEWRPDSPGDVPGDPAKYWFLAGVARKPQPAGRP
jgi:nucleotide-binding universal stress UspA family protein